jgi:thiol-disulfide isomerase/thioredoxin
MTRRGALFAAIGLSLACKEKPAQPAESDVRGGWYRATLESEDAPPIPFYLSLPSDPSKGGAVIMNGKQWFYAPHRWDTDQVEVELTVYRTKILAAIEPNGALFGSWESHSRAFGSSSLSFKAQRIEEPDPELKMRTSTSAAPSVDPSGIWRLDLSGAGRARLTVSMEGDTAAGATLWLANGETVYVSGNVIGDQMSLSSFDGTSPYLVEARIAKDTITGRWFTAPDLGHRETFTGKRVKRDFPFEEPVAVGSPDGRVRLPELESPRYVGHPVILQLAGSWCAHCKNATPVVSKLLEQYQDRGLRVLTIAYEFTDDPSYNLQRAHQLKAEYGITWQLTTRDGKPEDLWSILPSGLTGRGFPHFPITLFIDKNGRVHAVHAGFVGPESGEAYEALRQRFEDWTKAIL